MHQISKFLSLFLLLILSIAVKADQRCTLWLAEVISTQGKVDIQYSGNSNWQAVSLKQRFCHGDKIRTGKHSRVTLLFHSDSRATLDQNSTLVFQAPEKEAKSWYLELLQGSSFFRSRQPQRLNIQTPFINAVHQGTEFMVSVTSTQTEISVFDGRVAGVSPLGEIQINKGYIGIAKKSQPPQVKALTIRPEDAVQWTLYYPPIIDYQSSEFTVAGFKPAINAYQQGNIVQALRLLDNTPVELQQVNFLILKSSLLLTLGSVDAAIKHLDKVMQLDGNNSSAFALQSIIAVTKNRQDKAYQLAQKAVSLNPKSATAHIALSYAYQSQFKIELALKATQEAIRLSPDNALAWARLAELQLATGERSDAMESAKKAQILNPKLDRTQTILGFAYLAQIEIELAKAAFTEAIKLNTSEPLARLGLGLAKIRKGDIEEGTRDLETAVSLDPDNAIMRSYLGKAYYELRQEGFAATELAIAKEKDPNDPTPWFYSAILKQTTNRPIEALHDMHTAIDLNDNRGVYRSKLLLDEDLAARSASLGRIYNDLGFQQLGLVEGWKSVTTDPANYSAHRLLADTYASLPRHEITRVSELLQAQLLQPVNLTPIQPSLAESDRINSNSFKSSSFNEYNSLFLRNQFSLQGSGVVGNNDLFGEEIVHSGVWDKFSYSLGQFHFENDGIRKNNFTKQNIYNVFAQYQFSDQWNFQVEYKYNGLKNGDLSQQFNANRFSDTLKESFQRNFIRIGGKYHPNQSTNVLFTAAYSSDKFSQKLVDGASTIETINKSQAYNVEMQYLKQTKFAKFIIGGGYNNTNQPSKSTINTLLGIIPAMPGIFIPGIINIPPRPAMPLIRTDNLLLDLDSKHLNAYSYVYLKYNNITGIFGISYDIFNSKTLPDINRLNPKVGFIWDVTKSTSLRAAYLRAVKRPFVSNQTIEPSQIAGFGQYFDWKDGTVVETFGIGLDHKVNKKIYIGGEWAYRKLDVPVNTGQNNLITTDYEKQSNVSFRSYFNWTPLDQIAVGIEYQFDINDRVLNSLSAIDIPSDVLTHKIPLSLSYFSPNGIYSGFRATFVQQRVKDKGAFNSGNEHFWTIDATIGYRLPNRFGRFEFGVQNLLNEDYQIADINLVTGLSNRPQLAPERTIAFQFIFDFDS